MAYFWLALGLLLGSYALIDLFGLRDGPGQLPHNQEMIPAVLVIFFMLTATAILVLLRTKLGFYMGLILSFFMLLAIPIGTILGIITIKAYMDGKDAFGIE